MSVLKYVGIFLIASALGLFMENRERKAGIETWESKHDIPALPIWAIILIGIIGIVLIVISNASANM